MAEADIYAALETIFHDVFMRDDIKLAPAMTAKDIEGWDSFKQIEIILAVEGQYHFKFNTRELDSLLSVGDLVRVIAGKI
jgi:acyl carrier protein